MGIPWWFRTGARVRGVLTRVGLPAIVVGVLGMLVLPDATVAAWVAVAGFGFTVLGLALSLWPGAPSIEPVEVTPPVSGRWLGLNSPASKRPSHGTHGFGQTYAIDLLYEPSPGDRPKFGEGASFRPPQDFPAFGQPLVSPVDGTVVTVHDRARDHRSRSTWPAIIYLMLVEGFARELGGTRHVLGNHVVIDTGDGVYATLAHLRRGSVTVRAGDRVRRGDLVGRCGNTGNSSEPHVHFQLQDHRNPLIAAGITFTFGGVQIPANERPMVVQASSPTRSNVR
jgi:murein DD-endopeptidase MepM/ murein hydrolase activator NlpD